MMICITGGNIMMNIPVMPKECSSVKKPRSAESLAIEKIQNIRMQELGIDPYEYGIENDYSADEQELINEAVKLIILNQEVPEELAEKVKEITGKQ